MQENTNIDSMLAEWDRLSRAIRCILVAQPSNMTSAANELSEAYKDMSCKLLAFARQHRNLISS